MYLIKGMDRRLIRTSVPNRVSKGAFTYAVSLNQTQAHSPPWGGINFTQRCESALRVFSLFESNPCELSYWCNSFALR